MDSAGKLLEGAFKKPPQFFNCKKCGEGYTFLTTNGIDRTKEGYCLDCYNSLKKETQVQKTEQAKPSFTKRRSF